ncbi:alpha-N-acetylglucosaminidase-like [Oryza brachyantha]|uniref:alpha-N-acetylglucosaminidase-like n=1 Tax=Oryza brachyantha TaxID=4533 RepID=UPI001ADAE3FD|nr:alpha-N-acetylglucosaminidase-like [Oryza brachyantha]
MYETAKDITLNLVYLVEKYGFVLNRARSYYTDRRIQGTTAVELTSGLHWYLKYWCGAHISWDKTGGAQLASVPLPEHLPQVKGTGVKIEHPVPWNYHQNVVTSSLLFCPAVFHGWCLCSVGG